MNTKDIDFWGLCNGFEMMNYFKIIKDETFPVHIQTFFIAFRKTVLLGKAFN